MRFNKVYENLRKTADIQDSYLSKISDDKNNIYSTILNNSSSMLVEEKPMNFIYEKTYKNINCMDNNSNNENINNIENNDNLSNFTSHENNFKESRNNISNFYENPLDNSKIKCEKTLHKKTEFYKMSILNSESNQKDDCLYYTGIIYLIFP